MSFTLSTKCSIMREVHVQCTGKNNTTQACSATVHVNNLQHLNLLNHQQWTTLWKSNAALVVTLQCIQVLKQTIMPHQVALNVTRGPYHLKCSWFDQAENRADGTQASLSAWLQHHTTESFLCIIIQRNEKGVLVYKFLYSFVINFWWCPAGKPSNNLFRKVTFQLGFNCRRKISVH